MSILKEKGRWKTTWIINKFNDPNGNIAKILKNGVKIDNLKEKDSYLGHEEIKENCLLNSGINELWKLIAGISTNYFSNTGAKIGVGNDDTIAIATQSDLLGGSTNYQEMDATYPIIELQSINFRATFGTTEANFIWKEFVVKQNISSICLNRKVFSKGIKTVGETWVVDLIITIS